MSLNPVSSKKGVREDMSQLSIDNRTPKSMVRPKTWDEGVEDAYRFQLAGYRDETEYCAVKNVDAAERWPDADGGFIKKLQRKDGCFYYYDRARECPDKDVMKVKIYAY